MESRRLSADNLTTHLPASLLESEDGLEYCHPLQQCPFPPRRSGAHVRFVREWTVDLVSDGQALVT